MKLLMVMSMVMTIAVFATAGELIGWVFGKAFSESASGLQHIVMGSLFLFINQFFIVLFVICNRVKQGITVKIIELTACMGLNLLLVPGYGHMGSVWALVLSNGISSFGGYVVFRDFFQGSTYKHMIIIVLSGWGIVAALGVLSQINAILLFLLGMLFFTGVMFISKTVQWDELLPVMDILGWKLGRRPGE